MPCWYQAASRSNEANTNPLLQPRYAEEYLWIQSIANFEVDGLQQQKMTVCWFCQLRTGNRVTIHTDSPELHKKRLKNFPWSSPRLISGIFFHFLAWTTWKPGSLYGCVNGCAIPQGSNHLKPVFEHDMSCYVWVCVTVCVCILNCKVYLIKCPMGVEAY